MTVIWVHEEMLSPENIALREHPGAPAVFVFDDARLKANRWSLKRIVFLYECLMEMPVEIVRGDTVTEVRAFAEKRGAEEIVTVYSPDVHFGEVAVQLERLRVIPEEPFLELREPVDLRRFSRYWRKAERMLLP